MIASVSHALAEQQTSSFTYSKPTPLWDSPPVSHVTADLQTSFPKQDKHTPLWGSPQITNYQTHLSMMVSMGVDAYQTYQTSLTTFSAA